MAAPETKNNATMRKREAMFATVDGGSSDGSEYATAMAAHRVYFVVDALLSSWSFSEDELRVSDVLRACAILGDVLSRLYPVVSFISTSTS